MSHLMPEQQAIEPTDDRVAELKDNLDHVRSQIQTALRSRKDKSELASDFMPRLVCVSKLKPASDIVAAYKHGERCFGENYVQELEEKASLLKQNGYSIKWHFIGALQSNKCKVLSAIEDLHTVETVDSQKKVDLFQKHLSERKDSHRLRIFLQVNTSGEDSKAGLAPEPAEGKDELLDIAKHIISNCDRLHLAGLMTIGAIANSGASEGKSAEENPDFVTLKHVRDRLEKALKSSDIDPSCWGGEQPAGRPGKLELSMGMSGDFENAIKAGSTEVRVGSTLFGQRMSKAEAKERREVKSDLMDGNGGQ